MFQLNLPLSGTEVWWPGLVLLGAGIGFLTGMFGVGGGFLMTPLLKIVFGIPYPIAVGSDLLQIFITGSFSAWKHWRNKNVDVLMGIIMAGGSLIGTEIGVRLLKLIGDGGVITLNSRSFTLLDLVMSGSFLVLLTAVAISIWRETSNPSTGDEVAAGLVQSISGFQLRPIIAFSRSNIAAMSMWTPLSISILVGFLTGLLGVGGGFINFPLLVYVIGVPTSVAVGTSAFQIIFSTGYGAFRHAGQGHVELILVGLLLCGSLIGVQLGVLASRFFGGRKIRKYFVWVIVLGIVVICWDLICQIWF